jgi:hypothetical protein
MFLNHLLLKKLMLAVLAGTVIYAVAGFLVLPVYVKRSLENYASEVHGQSLQIEHVAVNPFTLALELSGITLATPENKPLIVLEQVYLNLDISGLVLRTLVINQLDISQPQLYLEYNGAGETSLAGLIQVQPGQAGPMAVVVKNMSIEDGSLQLLDTTRTPMLQTDWKQINLAVSNVSTHRDKRGSYTLNIDDAGGGKLRLAGDLQLTSFASSGTFGFEEFDVADLDPWINGLVAPGNAGGRMKLTGDYELAAADATLSLQLNEGQFSVESLQLRLNEMAALQARKVEIDFAAEVISRASIPGFELSSVALRADDVALNNPAAPADLLVLDQIRLTGGSLDWQNREVYLKNLSFTGGTVYYRRNATGRSDWAGIIAGIYPEQTDDSNRSSWDFLVDQVTTDKLEAVLVDAGMDQPVELSLGDIELLVSNLGTSPQQQGDFKLQMTVNRSGTLKGSGALNPAAGEVQASLTIAGIEIRAFNPYLGLVTSLEPRSGSIMAEFNAHYHTGSIAVDGQFGGRDLVFFNPAHDETVLTLDEITATGVTVEGLPPEISIDNIKLHKPFARIEISPDGDLNMSGWFRTLQRDETGTAGETNQPQQGSKLAVNRIEISDGRTNFSDLSLSPSFNMTIDDLDGAFTGFTLEPENTVALELKGRVNEYGSAVITGRLRPFNALRYSEINMSNRNIMTSVLSPYAARFAGREIASGRLNLDLKYLLNDGNLDGDHDIEFTNLVLGDRVKSPGAQDLPLDLAIALLEDSEGRINIKIPVSGNLDDPDFNLRTVIAKAAGNVIASVINAPFKLLSALIGSRSEALNAIPFEPGSAEITPPAMEMIAGLSDALQQRPGLALRTAGSYDPELDRDALARQQLLLHISLAAGLETYSPANSGPIAFSDPEIQDILEEFALSRLGKNSLEQFLDRDSSGEMDQETRYENIFNALLAAEEIPKENLERVARYRVQSIVDQFAQQGIEKARINIDENVRVTDSRERRILVELDLDTLQ